MKLLISGLNLFVSVAGLVYVVKSGFLIGNDQMIMATFGIALLLFGESFDTKIR